MKKRHIIHFHFLALRKPLSIRVSDLKHDRDEQIAGIVDAPKFSNDSGSMRTFGLSYGP